MASDHPFSHALENVDDILSRPLAPEEFGMGIGLPQGFANPDFDPLSALGIADPDPLAYLDQVGPPGDIDQGPLQFQNRGQNPPLEKGGHSHHQDALIDNVFEQHKQSAVQSVNFLMASVQAESSSWEHKFKVEQAKVRRLMQAVAGRDAHIAQGGLDPLPAVNFDGVEDAARRVLQAPGIGNTGAFPNPGQANHADGIAAAVSAAAGALAAAAGAGAAEEGAARVGAAGAGTPGPELRALMGDGNNLADDLNGNITKRKASKMDAAGGDSAEKSLDEVPTAKTPQPKKVKKTKEDKDTKNGSKKPAATSKMGVNNNDKIKGSKKANAAIPPKPRTVKFDPLNLKFEAQVYEFDMADSKIVSLGRTCAIQAVGMAQPRSFVKQVILQLALDHKPAKTTGALLAKGSTLQYSGEEADKFWEPKRGQLREICGRLQETAKADEEMVERHFVCILCTEAEVPALNEFISSADLMY